MAAKKYITLERLQHFKEKLDVTYVKRELKTDSEDEYKVLSDNNLTDELLQKIHNAGDSGFNGHYDSLVDKPTINGGELKKGTVSKDINVPEAQIEGTVPGSKCYFENDPTGGIIKWNPSSGKYGLVSVDSGISDGNVVNAKAMMSVRDVSTKEGSSIFGTDSGFFYCKDATNSTEGTELVVKKDISDMATKTQVGETYVEKTIEDEGNGVATIKNDKTGGVMSYKPTDGKSGLVAVDSGKNSNAQAKVMMRVVGSDYDGVAVYGTDNGFFYRKGTGLTADEQDELIVKRDISDMATKTQVGETYAEKTQVKQDIDDAKQELDGKIKAAATAAYKPKGSCTFSVLESDHAPSAEELGNVYNITDGFVTDEKFVEGQGHDYPGNTNVTIVAGDGPDEYKYDALAGFVDLTPYVKTADFEDVTDAEIDEMFE